MNIEIDSSGNKFKITITSDEKLRIKIPESYKNTPEGDLWIKICKDIFTQLIEKKLEPVQTLRGKATLNNVERFHNFLLTAEHSHSECRRTNEIRCRIDEKNEVNIEKYIKINGEIR
jgi:hypothetical protein